jgi:uncharacterized RDD family membrane protein YckC
MEGLGFGAWYKVRFGGKPIWLQAIAWFLYGFIWIPIWYASTRGKALETSSQGDAGDDLAELASTSRRFIGFLVDFSLIVLTGVAFGRLLYSAWDPYQRDRQSAEILQIALANAFAWYYWLLEGILGRTPGKFVTGTKVTRPDGTPAGWVSLLRMLIRLVPLEVLSLRNGVMWHDTWTGTRVVRWPARPKVSSVDSLSHVMPTQSVPQKQPSPRGGSAGFALADANQFLRYRASSRPKVDAQASLMDAVLMRSDAPPMKAALLRSADPNDEFPWLIVKSGTRETLNAMRGYAGLDPTFKTLFGDQPFSIVWADHVSENCPAPGEAVTPLGRERYLQVERALLEGKYVLERELGVPRS